MQRLVHTVIFCVAFHWIHIGKSAELTSHTSPTWSWSGITAFPQLGLPFEARYSSSQARVLLDIPFSWIYFNSYLDIIASLFNSLSQSTLIYIVQQNIFWYKSERTTLWLNSILTLNVNCQPTENNWMEEKVSDEEHELILI